MIDFDDLEDVEDGGQEADEDTRAERARKAAGESQQAPQASRSSVNGNHTGALSSPAANHSSVVSAASPDSNTCWKLVHSIDAGGITVQCDEEKNSATVGRLTLGSVVKEVRRAGNRMLYLGLQGHCDGPLRGWVNFKTAGPWGKPSFENVGDYHEWKASGPAPEQPLSVAQTRPALILLDWDDTLLPTTWIQEHPELHQALQKPREDGTVRRTGRLWDQLERQAQTVAQLLRVASALGTVIVVTLSRRPWVQTSVADFMPAIEEEVRNLEIIYASEQHIHEMRPGMNIDPLRASKKRAMELAMDSIDKQQGATTKWENLVSIGDADAERNAAKDLGRECKVGDRVQWTKTVKLMENPNARQLTSELQQLKSLLVDLVEHPGTKNLDLTA